MPRLYANTFTRFGAEKGPSDVGNDLLCYLWVWRRRIKHRPCCPPISNPTTSSWAAPPSGSGRWDSRLIAQHLSRDLVRPSSGLKNSLKACSLEEKAGTTLFSVTQLHNEIIPAAGILHSICTLRGIAHPTLLLCTFNCCIYCTFRFAYRNVFRNFLLLFFCACWYMVFLHASNRDTIHASSPRETFL